MQYAKAKHVYHAFCAALGRVTYLAVMLLGLTLSVTQAAAAVDCEGLATRIGRAEGLPEGLLPAISRIEAGRRFNGTTRAWPWTLNHAGKGYYFDSRAEALAYLRKATKKGKTNIDVGCMQVNHRWHGEAFQSLESMLDPQVNIRYAVKFLKSLYARTGSWEKAVRHYHSPNPKFNDRYLRAYKAAFRDMRDTKKTGFSANYLIGAGAMPVLGGEAQPFFSTQSNNASVDATYANLLAMLDGPQNGGTTNTDFIGFAGLTNRQNTRGVVNHNWDKVQSFRKAFANQ